MKRYPFILLAIGLLALVYSYFRPYWQEKPCCGPPAPPTATAAPTLTPAPEDDSAATAPPPTVAPDVVFLPGHLDRISQQQFNDDIANIEIYQLDDAHDGRTAQTWLGGAVTIPAESVQLVILTP